MLVAVPDLEAPGSWVQVLGRIAVHIGAGEPKRLTGSAQRLLSVLVAAGPDGATSERIAEEIWGDEQPNPWRPALRMAVARLRKQLPPTWDVISDGGVYRIDTSEGWIDAWRLDEVASSKTDVGEQDLTWMLAGAPFGEIDLLEMVGSSTQHLRMLQITVAERFCGQAVSVISTPACSALTSLVRDHPYNEHLALVVGRALATAGRRTEALGALTAFAETYASEFGAVPTELESFLTSGGTEAVASDATAAVLPPMPAPVLAKELRHLSDAAFFGREHELETIRAARGALVTGATGSGKSRLLAALIVDDETTETTYVVGDDRLDLELGPFAVAMPDLRNELLANAEDEVGAARDDGSGDRATSTRAWRIVLAHLEARSTNVPQRLVVDDAHLLDPASLGLLRLLVRSNTAADVTVVVCGRSDFDDRDWSDFVRDGERSGLDAIVLEGLDLEALKEMVYLTFPDATRQARHGLAIDVHDASAGLPAVAGPLIASADPVTLALPEQLPGASALARVTASLSARAPEVVAASAVLGHQFSIGALMALTELDESSIFDVLDELWSTGLIVETEDPDQVRFRHVLIQRAFLEGIPLFRRGQLHRRAARLTEDLHERADHQANAGTLVPAQVAAESLKASAELYAKSRQWRKVVRQFRRAAELPNTQLDCAALTLWAAALDQSGADGSEQREQAFELASQAQDWSAALDAALSGLPEAEKPDGDQTRIEMLESIPGDALPADRQFDRVFNLSRQYALAGNHVEAIRNADLSLELSGNGDELGLSHVSRWTATRHVDPTPYQFPEDVITQISSTQVRARIAQMNALNEAERGDYRAARREAERFDALAAELGDPLRIWQSLGLRSMFLMNEGKFAHADQVALEALAFSDLHGMQLGTSTYIGQRVHSFNVQQRLAEVGETLEPYRVNMAMSILGRAALVLCDHAQGATDLGAEVQNLAAETLDRDAAFSPVILVFLSSLIPEFAPGVVDETRRVLERFADQPLMAGFGGADFGPTSRYVASLVADQDERREIVGRTVVAADKHGEPLWRVICRLDAAELGIEHMSEQARELAANTDLEAVVVRRIGAS